MNKNRTGRQTPALWLALRGITLEEDFTAALRMLAGEYKKR